MPLPSLPRSPRLLHLALAAVFSLVLAGCLQTPSTPSTARSKDLAATPTAAPVPIVFIHGENSSAAQWQTMLWRFESQGWPRERLFAASLPLPLLPPTQRAEERIDVAGAPGMQITSSAPPPYGYTDADGLRDFIAQQVQQALAATGAHRVAVVAQGRSGLALRDYVRQGGGQYLSHAVTAGTPHAGAWKTEGLYEHHDFAPTGPYLRGLNQQPPAQPDGLLRWLSIGTTAMGPYAMPPGSWTLGEAMAARQTPATFRLAGAPHVELAQASYPAAASSDAAFEALFPFLSGKPPAAPAAAAPGQNSRWISAEAQPQLSGTVVGRGHVPSDPASGHFLSNLPLAGASVQVFAVHAVSGQRQGAAVYATTTGADGRWGPFSAQPGIGYEFEVDAPGYDLVHIYRAPFPRSSALVQLQAERLFVWGIGSDDQGSLTLLRAPRGDLEDMQAPVSFNGQQAHPNPGGPLLRQQLKLFSESDAIQPQRLVRGQEAVVGRNWSLDAARMNVLELHE